MKKIVLIFILLLASITSFAQFLGIGSQYADAKGKGNAIQFVANASFPYIHKKNSLNSYISAGIDYTGGSSPVSGLNIKPVSVTTFFNESFFNSTKYTVLLSCDAGYLFNFRHGKDGIVVTPNLYIDYKYFFVKTGYDFNVTGGERQFFVRAGFCFGMGVIKNYAETKIW